MTAALTSTTSGENDPDIRQRRDGGAAQSLELTADERDTMSTLAVHLTQAARSLVDDDAWLAEARRTSCHMPSRLREALRGYRYDSGTDGTLAVTNLPIPLTLPPTPNVRDSVERAATVPAALAMLVGLQLGEVIAYRDEKHGALLQNVVPVPALANSQSNGGSVPLEFHTENAFHPNRPDFVALLCLRGAQESSVGTLIAPVRRALALLDPSDLAVLQQNRYATDSPPSFHTAERTAPHPLLNGAPDDPDILVDFNATHALDDEAAAAMHRLRDVLLAVRTELVLPPGGMVFLDNRMVVHGRGAFAPRYDGSDRWLHRIFVHLDSRRTRPARDAHSMVLR
ncbi:TauD/TfdA family dioxygenase [Dactylosporangium sp. NPDC048998]|uniref:TauD/TfdA family dioxygenase n=1 Tax=Dactylosporangium sp. NPDC048998 TaxID=3363976 RepID=UPI00371F50D6